MGYRTTVEVARFLRSRAYELWYQLSATPAREGFYVPGIGEGHRSGS
jgi:hypothetical protein